MNLRRHRVASQSLCILLSSILLISGCISFGPCKKGNCVDGHGVHSDGKGAVYTGEFKDGKYHGNGEMRWTMGTYGDHHLMFSGTATGIWKNGEIDTGTIDQFTPRVQSRNIKHIENGQCTYCTVTQKDGSQYVYTFSNGTYTQKFIYANGQVYVGQLKIERDYLPHGTGTMTFPDGKKYVGEWKDGQPTTGVYYSANGTPIKTPKGISTSNILLGLGLLFIGALAVSSLGGGTNSSKTGTVQPHIGLDEGDRYVTDPDGGSLMKKRDYIEKYGQ